MKSDKPNKYQYVLEPNELRDTIDYCVPGLVVCEGRSDANFLSVLFDCHKIDGFKVTFPRHKQDGGEGASSIGRCLNAIMTGTDVRRVIKKVIIVQDCDDSPEKSFRQAQAHLKSAQLGVPDRPTQLIDGKSSVAILMIPDVGTKGTLETLLLQAIREADSTSVECVDKFADCLEAPRSWSENKRAKMKLNALIAGCCKEDPASSLSLVWSKQGNPIPIDSPHFGKIAEFFRSVAGS